LNAATIESSIGELIASRTDQEPVRWRRALLLAGTGAAAFHAAFAIPALSCLIIIYAYSLVALGGAPTGRLSFRLGLALGFLTFSPHLFWFWNIFGPVAICLWTVLSFFTGIFVCGIWYWNQTVGRKALYLAAPILWTALEYFRGEIYFLRFSWLSVGSVFSERIGAIPLEFLGVYGVGFVVFALAAAIDQRVGRRTVLGLLVACLICAGLVQWPAKVADQAPGKRVMVAGIQLEFPPELMLPEYLNTVIEEFPAAEIIVLSEYTLDGTVPKRVRDWCRENRRYLIVGGKDDTANGDYYNTAFVVGPGGAIEFKQAKSVPIQFFKDGLAAQTLEPWDSPWGKIGIGVCYDLSYRRVMDRLVEQGTQAFIIPFMDLAEWGAYQHELHGRVAPVRAREYVVPIFRLGSSGISQNVDARGNILGEASCPGQEVIFGGEMRIGEMARRPVDAWLAPVCLGAVVVAGCFGVARRLRNRR
jgi:apolipoprotein N-acyltransferase